MPRGTKKAPKTPADIIAALQAVIEHVEAQAALARQALAITLVDDEGIAYYQRCLHPSHFRILEEIVAESHLPANLHRTTLFRQPDDISALLRSTLPSGSRDLLQHDDELFCRTFHAELPPMFCDEWDAWKATSEATLAACAGARAAFEERMAHGRKLQERLKARGMETSLTAFGEVIIPRSYDPWADRQLGQMEGRYQIVERTVWGYDPQDRPPEDLPDMFIDARCWSGGGRTSLETDMRDGLRIALTRKYKELERGERVAMSDIPIDHWFQTAEHSRPRQRTKSTRDDTLVIYLGEEAESQLALLAT